jgi:hypothetical protein
MLKRYGLWNEVVKNSDGGKRRGARLKEQGPRVKDKKQ